MNKPNWDNTQYLMPKEKHALWRQKQIDIIEGMLGTMDKLWQLTDNDLKKIAEAMELLEDK